MPELPEVETVVRDLRPLLVGRTIAASRSATRRRNSARLEAGLGRETERGAKVRAIRRRGKWILVGRRPQPALATIALAPRHDRATHRSARTRTEVADHTHLRFALDRGKRRAPLPRHPAVRLRDAVRHGRSRVSTAFLNARLGPEPFGLDPAFFRGLLKTSRSLKAILLLDQTALAGVGNIYADEACFPRRRSPRQSPHTMTAPPRARRLRLPPSRRC